VKKYNKRKKKFFIEDKDIVYRILHKASFDHDFISKFWTHKVQEAEVKTFTFNTKFKEWHPIKRRKVITFNLSGDAYDVLYPECQVVLVTDDTERIHFKYAKELTKIIFKDFKRTREYYEIPKEKRIEWLK